MAQGVVDPKTEPSGPNSLSSLGHMLTWWAVIVVGHALLLDSGFNNLEFAFADAARYFADVPRDGRELERYWANQANPLGYSFIAALWVKIVGHENSFWVYRVPAVMGGMLIILSGYIWSGTVAGGRVRVFPVWCACVSFNPLIWCYTGQATADVLPTGVILAAFSLCRIAGEKTAFHFASTALFAAACIVKFNSLLLFPIFATTVLFNANNQGGWPRRFATSTLYAIIPVATLAAYWIWLNREHNVFILPEKFKGVYSENTRALNPLDVFWSYVSYLAMVCLPFCVIRPLANLFRRHVRDPGPSISAGRGAASKAGESRDWPLFAFAVVCGLCGLAGMLRMRAGEMDQGGFDAIAPRHFFNIVKSVCLVIGAYSIADWAFDTWRRRSSLEFAMLSGVVPYLIVSSMTRPAQRYLILILPFVMWWTVERYSRTRNVIHRFLEVVGIAACVVASIVGCLYLAAQGNAADRMARWILENNLADLTNPDAISQHAGQYFSPAIPDDARYVVAIGRDDSALHSEQVRLLGFHLRDYSLVPVPIPKSK